MGESENLDIGRVVSLIMQNPQLIEQISALAKQNTDEISQAPTEDQIQEPTAEAVSITQDTYQASGARGDRARLLGALKPYVSSERAKAIDSMISIADILDMMRSR